MLTNESSYNDVGFAIKSKFSRRKFLTYASASSALLITAASCKKDNNGNNTSGGVDLRFYF